MDFEDILDDIGSFGLYQKVLVVSILPLYVVIPWFTLDMIFMSSTPEHWCYVPEVANSNLTLQMQKQLVQAPLDSSCLMNDINYSQILLSGNFSIDTSWPTKQCSNGWQYDNTDYDATAVTRWNMVCDDAHYSSLALSLTYIGSLCGTPLYGFLSDKFGRKLLFFGLAILVSVTEIGSTLSPNFILFLVLRAINGTAMVTIYVSGYVILVELMSPAYRTHVNGAVIMAWTTGLCLLPLTAWLTRNWIHLSTVVSSTAIGFLLYWKLLPESPRWLILQDRNDEAFAILAKISKINGKTVHEGNQLMDNIQKINDKIKKQKAIEDTQSVLDILKYPLLRKRFLLVTACWCFNSIAYYGVQMNVKNLAGSEFFNYFLVSVVEIPAHALAWYCMDHVGRRWCSVFAFISTATACLMPIILSPECTRVDVIASLFGKAGASIAFMTIYQQCPELIPTSLRGAGMGLSSTLGTGTTLLVPYIVYLAKFGAYIPFLIFSIISLLAGICASFLPETLNKNLPQTVTDAENFEKNFKFFSFTGGTASDSNSKEEQNNKTPVKPSIAV